MKVNQLYLYRKDIQLTGRCGLMTATEDDETLLKTAKDIIMVSCS